ncbi:MAG: hypothetical protein ACREXS_03980 [Gammaproteobacteria bacterium]
MRTLFVQSSTAKPLQGGIAVLQEALADADENVRAMAAARFKRGGYK